METGNKTIVRYESLYDTLTKVVSDTLNYEGGTGYFKPVYVDEEGNTFTGEFIQSNFWQEGLTELPRVQVWNDNYDGDPNASDEDYEDYLDYLDMEKLKKIDIYIDELGYVEDIEIT